MKKRAVQKQTVGGTRKTNRPRTPAGYVEVLADMKRLIADSRRRALASINRELVCLYWQIGAVIVRQQETAKWGDGVVEQFAQDLRGAFPDLTGLSRDNVFRMRQFMLACRDVDRWLKSDPELIPKVGAVRRQIREQESNVPIVGAAPRQLEKSTDAESSIAPSLDDEIQSPILRETIQHLSWTHHHTIMGAVESPDERFFYMAMSVRERWSTRELRRQIDADLFTRYLSVKRDPEKCLPAESEAGDLLPFKDHYVLEFLGLEDEHSEAQLRHAILANLRDFFLEFGKDLTFVGEEYPLTVDADTFHVDLLFFHRRLQCLIAIDLKKGKFKPEHVGKMRFYCAALDDFVKLPHENPTLGLVLCRSASAVQVRLALTDAAERIGVATYQTALPDERLIRKRISQLPDLPKDDD